MKIFWGNKRKLLNFGHTVGHLVEKDSNYEITHGQAVAIGIYYELLISKEQLGLPKEIIDSLGRPNCSFEIKSS